MSRRGMGFTLIELLVVIAILSLLAALLFPVFAEARAKAYQARCTSNLRQIGLALFQYAEDYDEALILSQYFPSGAPLYPANHFAGWAGPVNLYVHATGVFRCPTDSEPDGTVDGEAAQEITYFYNENLVQDNYPAVTTLAQLSVPAATVLVTENTAGVGVQELVRLQDPGETDSVVANSFRAVGGAAERHQGGRLYLLGDGHVVRLTPSVVSTGVDQPLPPYQTAFPASSLPPPYQVTFNYH